MATAFYHPDSLAKSAQEWHNCNTKQFDTIEEAQAWAERQSARSRWFKLIHISPSNVESIPLYLVIRHENGKYMNTLCVRPEDFLEEVTVICPLKQSWGFHRSTSVASFSTNGSLYSVRATDPTYIDVFQPGWENVAYVLLGGCERPIPGLDKEACEALLALKPGIIPDFEFKDRILDLKYPGQGKLVTRAMKKELADLEAAKEAYYEVERKKRDEAYHEWYALVIEKLAP